MAWPNKIKGNQSQLNIFLIGKNFQLNGDIARMITAQRTTTHHLSIFTCFKHFKSYHIWFITCVPSLSVSITLSTHIHIYNFFLYSLRVGCIHHSTLLWNMSVFLKNKNVFLYNHRRVELPTSVNLSIWSFYLIHHS